MDDGNHVQLVLKIKNEYLKMPLLEFVNVHF